MAWEWSRKQRASPDDLGPRSGKGAAPQPERTQNMTTKTHTSGTEVAYALAIDPDGNWAIMRTNGTHTSFLPERFPRKNYTKAKKFLTQLTQGN